MLRTIREEAMPPTLSLGGAGNWHPLEGVHLRDLLCIMRS